MSLPSKQPITCTPKLSMLSARLHLLPLTHVWWHAGAFPNERTVNLHPTAPIFPGTIDISTYGATVTLYASTVSCTTGTALPNGRPLVRRLTDASTPQAAKPGKIPHPGAAGNISSTIIPVYRSGRQRLADPVAHLRGRECHATREQSSAVSRCLQPCCCPPLGLPRRTSTAFHRKYMQCKQLVEVSNAELVTTACKAVAGRDIYSAFPHREAV